MGKDMKAIIIIAITAVICLGGIMFRGRKDQKEKEEIKKNWKKLKKSGTFSSKSVILIKKWTRVMAINAYFL